MIKNTFYLVRHGQTRWNEEGRFQGRSDIPLSPEGRRQALGNARRLRAHLEADPAVASGIEILSSPLARCTETMRVMADELGLPGTARRIEPRLIEAGFGRWEGITTHDVKARFPEERRLRKADRWRFTPQGGTSHEQTAADMRSLVEGLPVGRGFILVSHSGNLRVMFAMLQRLDEAEAMRIPVPHDRVFAWDGERLKAI